MGEAKRRAERRREAREAEQAKKPAGYVEVRLTLQRSLATQLRARHQFVKEQCPSFDTFVGTLILEGVEVFDQDLEAYRRHLAGESTPVAPEAPKPDSRLVVPAGEVDPRAVKTLAQMHDATLAAARG